MIQKERGIKVSLPNRAERCEDLFQVQQRTECLILPNRHTRRTFSPYTAHTEREKSQNKHGDVPWRRKLKPQTTICICFHCSNTNWVLNSSICNVLQLQHRYMYREQRIFKRKAPTPYNQQGSEDTDGKFSFSSEDLKIQNRHTRFTQVSNKRQTTSTGSQSASRQVGEFPQRISVQPGTLQGWEAVSHSHCHESSNIKGRARSLTWLYHSPEKRCPLIPCMDQQHGCEVYQP